MKATCSMSIIFIIILRITNSSYSYRSLPCGYPSTWSKMACVSSDCSQRNPGGSWSPWVSTQHWASADLVLTEAPVKLKHGIRLNVHIVATFQSTVIRQTTCISLLLLFCFGRFCVRVTWLLRTNLTVLSNLGRWERKKGVWEGRKERSLTGYQRMIWAELSCHTR